MGTAALGQGQSCSACKQGRSWHTDQGFLNLQLQAVCMLYVRSHTVCVQQQRPHQALEEAAPDVDVALGVVGALLAGKRPVLQAEQARQQPLVLTPWRRRGRIRLDRWAGGEECKQQPQ